MQNVSANYQRLQASQNKWYETRVDIQGVGVVSETDGLLSVGTSLEMFHGSPTIGSAVAGEIEFSLLEQSATIPYMAKIQPQVRVCGTAAKSSSVTVVGERLIPQSASYSNENITISTAVDVSGENIIFPVDGEEYAESEWIPQGVFYIDTREVTANNDGLNILTIHGFDAMLKAEQDYSGTAVGGDYDTAYVRAIAAAIGAEVDDRTWDIMQTGYIIPFPLGYSMREVLGFIAASYAGCFIITDEGKLRLISLPDLAAETNLLIDAGGDYITFGYDHPETENTYTGSVVSFDNGGSTEITDVAVDIEPVQDLHGYDSPWPPGGGKNKLPYFTSRTNNGVVWTVNEQGIITANGTSTAVSNCFIGSATTSANSKFDLPNGEYILSGGYSSKIFIALFDGDTTGTRYNCIGSPVNVTITQGYATVRVGASSGTVTDGAVLYPMLRSAMEQDATYVPYSNECPISGWAEAKVWVNPVYDPTANPTITIQLGQTVYGGTLDVTTGKLTVTRCLKTFTGDEPFVLAQNTRRFTNTYIELGMPVPKFTIAAENASQSISSCGTYCSGSTTLAPLGGYRLLSANANFYDVNSVFGTAAAFKSYLSDNYAAGKPWQLCYELATPFEIQLDPVQIATLEGINTIWADAGDVSVTAVTAGGETVKILV